jgi:hypothetical protein
MKGRLLLNVAIEERTTILKLLTSEGKALLIRWDSQLILNLGLNIIDGIRWLDIEGNSLISQSLNEDLHPHSQPQDERKRRILLSLVIDERTNILKLLTSDDEALLIRWDSQLILNLGLSIIDGSTLGKGLISENTKSPSHRRT